MAVDGFRSLKVRRHLAAALNTLLAAPSFASGRPGVSLSPPPAISVSLAHLDDDERTSSSTLGSLTAQQDIIRR
jgi:hypothetical protein